MKKILFSLLLQAGATVFAQKPIIISVGGGMNNTSSVLKNNNYLGNGYDVQADAFVPFYRKGWDGTVKGKGLALGINVLIDYARVKNLSPDNVGIAGQYQVYGGNTVVTSQSDAKMSGSVSGMIGVQGIISFGKFNLSPSLHAGYLHLKQQGYVQNGSAEINGQAYETALAKSEAQSASGFVFMPQVKIGYNITPGFSLFVSPSVVIGPEVKRTARYLTPQGGFNDKKTYELKQLANGTWENSSTTTGRYNLTRLNFGISWILGRKLKSSTTKMPSRLSMTPTTTRQTQGKTFGEKVSQGIQSAAAQTNNPLYEGKGNQGENPLFESSNQAKPGNPIGGNPVSDKGINEAGINETEAAAREEKRTYTGGRKNEPQESVAAAGIGGMAKPGGAVSSSYAAGRVAGAPLKGVGVKLGRNLSNSAQIKAVTNEKGEAAFDIPEPGSYKIILTAPEKAEAQDFNTTRSNRERSHLAANPGSGASGEATNATRPGEPLKSVEVKLGKSPDNSIQMKGVTNKKGEVKFDIPEMGAYKIIIQTPEKMNESKPERKKKEAKVKEKPTSGLKDTLKTNV